MDIIFLEKNTVYLNTGLNEYSFSKIANRINFSEQGTLVRFNLFEDNFQFSKWNFSGTVVKDNLVCFNAKAFDAKTAWSILKSKDENQIARLTFALNKVFSKAIENKIQLPTNGLGGILYNEKIGKNNSNIQIELLFLPENLFETFCLNANEQDYAFNQGMWQNKVLTSNNAHIFTQSVLTYYAFTQIFPFSKTNTSNRQEDIFDSVFIKVELLVQELNQNLATSIDMGFNIDNQYEREKCLIDLQLLKEQLALNDDGTINQEKKKQRLSKEEFSKLVKQNSQKNEKIAARKRFFRKNIVAIIICFAIIAIIPNLIFKKFNDNQKKPCAKGLTCFETIETFYTGFHTQKSDLMKLVSKGKNTNDIIDMVSTIYVSSTIRTAYEGKNTSLAPEIFLTRPELMHHWIFGITNLRIDGEFAHNYFIVPTVKEYSQLKKQGAIPLHQGSDFQTHQVTYYLITKSGEQAPFVIDKCLDTIQCEYIKDQWYITKIETSHYYQEIPEDEFLSAYNELYKENQSPAKTVRELRNIWNWLPDERAMFDAAIIAESQKNYQVEY